KQRAPSYAEAIEQDEVVELQYEDRYLKSPWAVAMLANILKSVKLDDEASLSVVTMPGDGRRQSRMAWDDWANEETQRVVSGTFLRATLGAKQVDFQVSHNRQELTHRRVLSIGLASGRTIKLAFDQGMGYWGLKSFRHDLKYFDFELGLENQLKRMLELEKDGRLVNSGGWPTDISIYESSGN
ncbi:helicase, partial [Marinobacter sp. Z-F4-2]